MAIPRYSDIKDILKKDFTIEAQEWGRKETQ